MLQLNKIKFIVLILAISNCACDDIFEKDISGSILTLITPADSISTKTSFTQFRWEPVDGAIQYRLRIASPNFSKPEKLITDTTVFGTSFDYGLPEGNYEWQVRGENGSSFTLFTTRTLFIDTINDLDDQIQTLKLPNNGAVFDTVNILFRWETSSLANDYTIEIHRNNWAGELIEERSGIASDTIRLTLPEGKFVWAVKAVGETGSTPFSEIRIFYVDLTSPIVSTAVTPAAGERITDFPFSFTWSRAQDSGTTLRDSLFILSENGLAVPSFPAVLVTSSQYSLESLPNGRYQWKLKTIDLAGNQSQISTGTQFIVE